MVWRRLLIILIILTYANILFGIAPDTLKQLTPKFINRSISDTLKHSSIDLKKLKPDTVKHFKFGGVAIFTLNQVNVSHWVAGGENALSATGIANIFLNYKKNKTVWENCLDASYGIIKNETSKIVKNTDKFDFNSKFGTEALGKFYYSALLNYRSQFSKGYNYPNTDVVSNFNSPGYISLGLGMDYKPANFFSLFLSPATGRVIIVADQKMADAGDFGVDSAVHRNGIKVKDGENTWFNFGATLSANFKKDICKNINLASKLLIFNNYTAKKKEDRKNFDVTWGMLLNIRAGKFISTTVQMDLIYNKAAIDKIQFKESLGVGVSFKF
jgi:hypothetical protein